MANKQIILAFDAYGTLLSTESIAKKLGEHFGDDKAAQIAAEWRVQQLEYTWRMNSMNKYEPFSSITDKSLQAALAIHGLELREKDLRAVLAAYDTLSIFPDVPACLNTVSEDSSIYPVVFSNGTQHMVTSSVSRSPDLSTYQSVFKDVVVVEEVRKYKPAPEVYKYLAKKVGKEDNMGDMWLVSGNPFDVVGARAVGMKAAWVDRAGKGWTDRLGGKPTIIVKSLEELVGKVKEVEVWFSNRLGMPPEEIPL